MSAINARALLISIAATEYNTQVFSASIDSDDADTDEITFAEAAAGGGRAYTLAIKLTQDAAASTLWTRIFDAAGTDVAVLLKPYGNATATVTQPHFSVTANVREPNGTFLGGEADASPTKRQTIEVEWPCLAKPVRITA